MTSSALTPNRESSSRDEHGTFKALLVVAGGVVAALHVWKLSPALGTLSEQLNMSLGQAGVLVAVIQVAGMVLGMIVGLFNDSIGLRRGCLWGFGFLAVGSVLGALRPDPGSCWPPAFWRAWDSCWSAWPRPR
ncbi:MFS transporter [Kocuria atrinae]|uniref:MFS transporter n=1 Tax=Kocuria atrinae TaxID=592377 RepID=UPI001CB9AAAE|nr:MFS transporter [Kocuria atrinae]